ncbi:MAG: FlgD immunoglobulin-like domain containing protein [Candidatus Eisenbacteria bacterium]
MKRPNRLVFPVSLLLLLFGVSAAGAEERLVRAGGASEWSGFRNAVRGSGGRILQAFPPAGAIVAGDDAFWLATSRLHPHWSVDIGPVPVPAPEATSRPDRFLAAAWNRRFAPPAKRAPHPGGAADMGMEHAAPGGRGDPGPSKTPPGANFYDTSEFLIGTVAIGILMPESDGSIDPSTEDWTQAEIDSVVDEVQAGLAWWIGQAPGGNLSFVFDVPDPVPCPYEPITRNAFTARVESIWTKAVFDTLGYTTGDAWFKGRSYLNDLRETYDTDWAVAVFVVDSKNDANGKFANLFYGFSYYGGPYMVMTYDSGPWTIAGLHAVTAHEIGHSFYGLDEYFGAHKGCTLKAGYLLEQNQNSEWGTCFTDDPCIMRDSLTRDFDSNAVCPYTHGQIGLRDTDTDDVADILDTYPSTILSVPPPDTTSVTTPSFAGSTWVNPLPNLNTIGEGNDITLNTIARVEYRVSGGLWIPADAADGTFDSAGEAYVFTTAPLPEDSLYLFEIRAVNSAGNADTIPALDTVYIFDGTAPGLVQGLAATPVDSTVVLTWTNPADADLQSVVLRFGTVAAPADTGEGFLLEVRPALPGTADTLVHAGLFPDTTYHYSLFTLDEVPNVSGPATASGTPLYPSAPPALHRPAPGSLYVAAATEFAWAPVPLPDPSDTLTAYRLQVALDSVFGALLVDSVVTTGSPADTLWGYGDLLLGTPHWWRVRGQALSSGTWGYWSQGSLFTTELLVTEIGFLDSTVSAYTNFADGDSLEANTDALVEARVAPADTLGLGGFTAWVHWAGAASDSAPLAWDRDEGGYGYWRGSIPYGAAFERGDTVTFSVSARSPNDPGMADDKGGLGYAFVGGRRALPGWHIPESVEPVLPMRHPFIPVDTDTAVALRVGSPTAEPATGGEVFFRVLPGPLYGIFPLAPETIVGDSTYLSGLLDSSFSLDDTVEYYLRIWGDETWDTTFVYGTNSSSSVSLWEVNAAAAPFTFLVHSVTGVDETLNAFLPARNELFRNQPNPFNPTTAIPFALARPAPVTVVLYDARGRTVRILVDETRPAGWHSVVWNGRTDGGTDAGSGVYFAVIRAGDWRETMKILLLR